MGSWCVKEHQPACAVHLLPTSNPALPKKARDTALADSSVAQAKSLQEEENRKTRTGGAPIEFRQRRHPTNLPG
jgi:hypothetical protein